MTDIEQLTKTVSQEPEETVKAVIIAMAKATYKSKARLQSAGHTQVSELAKSREGKYLKQPKYRRAAKDKYPELKQIEKEVTHIFLTQHHDISEA